MEKMLSAEKEKYWNSLESFIEENERENLLNMFLKLKRKVHQYCSKDERDWLDNMCETIFGF